ncbi:sensor histidine kinase [Microbacterium sp. STN6]|uniref:sensor histidine kinase n=1 Tax=Microbacterium sp. STN6 TaxID=2995588 RepID=UPI002260FF1E|nr:sensor histidine kinase [Microbacterium sp. STN6]MCX7522923.1 sensor histidine kinase [Microbacterium sp. STN6]
MHAPFEIDTEWVRPRVGRQAIRRDALVALALLVGTLLSAWLYSHVGIYTHPAPAWQTLVWSLGMSLPLAARRVAPITVTAVMTVVFFAGQMLSVPELLFSNITLFLAFYSIGAWSRRRTVAMIARASIITVVFVWLFASLILGGDSDDARFSTAGAFSPYLAFGLISILTNMLYFGAAYVFGEAAFRSARQRASLEARSAELLAEREKSASQAVALERVRIARELHDVVAHHVSVMGVQAGAARLVLGRDAARASDSLAAIESNARAAVDELHLMLRTLRDDEAIDAPHESTSTRGLAQLDALATDAGGAGLPVDIVRVGQQRPLPPTIDLSAYRIAQESLTNTRKHAGGAARAEIRVRYLDDALELEITDDGIGTPTAVARASTAGGGLGQRGMRERVTAVGGSIEFGPRPRGGYRVRARFPLETIQVSG